jgi:hypothetical protein
MSDLFSQSALVAFGIGMALGFFLSAVAALGMQVRLQMRR